jgi:hypothetical protein
VSRDHRPERRRRPDPVAPGRRSRRSRPTRASVSGSRRSRTARSRDGRRGVSFSRAKRRSVAVAPRRRVPARAPPAGAQGHLRVAAGHEEERAADARDLGPRILRARRAAPADAPPLPRRLPRRRSKGADVGIPREAP